MFEAKVFSVKSSNYVVVMLDGPRAGQKKTFVHKKCTLVEAGADPADTVAGEAPPAASGAQGDTGAESNKPDDAEALAAAKKAAPNKHMFPNIYDETRMGHPR